MTERQLILNTLVYNDDVVAGTLQLDLLPKIVDLGVESVEVRREFFNDLESELAVVAAKSQELGLSIYLSIPDMLFNEGGVLNPMFEQYVAEAEVLHSVAMKMNVGHFTEASDETLAELRDKMSKTVKLNVENDQTELNGTMAPIKEFLTLAGAEDLNIDFVFDSANWRFVDEDEMVAAELLYGHTDILHLKNVIKAGDGLEVVPFDKGVIDWKALIESLPLGTPIALEYPTTSLESLRKDVNTLRAFVKQEEQS
jgi:Sugar phosphate isomerases/epimerases